MDGDPSQSKSWNFQDLRNLASDWNLKGDRALLQILENIHKDVLAKAKTTNDNLEALSSSLSEASISLLNVNNRFTSLGNTQFIENKVQEDDIVTVNKVEENDNIVTDKSKQSNDRSKENDKLEILNTVSKSLDVLESLCEKIHISTDTDSGSDDSDNNEMSPNIILRPQDNYIDKPLPYIIGSKKWQNKWHIGLQECSSDESDGECENTTKKKEEIEYSSSDELSDISPGNTFEVISKKKSQMTLPIPKSHVPDNQSSLTSTSTNNSTEAADSEVAKINRIQRDSIRSISDIRDPLAYDEADTSANQNKPAPQTLVRASDFAAELARKLGGNVPQQEPPAAPPSTNKTSENVKNKMAPMSTPLSKPTNRLTGNIFLDEPPPVDSQLNNDARSNDNFLSDSDNNEDVSTGLFGDESSIFHSSSRNDVFTNTSSLKSKTTSSYGGLFDDLPSNDANKKNNNPIQVNKKQTSLFDDGDSDDDMGIFNTKSTIKPSVNQEQPSKNSSVAKIEKKPETSVKKVEATSLFDDSSNSDDDHLFGSSAYVKKSKPETSGENNPEPTKNVKNIKSDDSKLKLSKSLFDDISDSDDDLFSSNSKSKIQVTKTSSKGSQNVLKNVKVETKQPIVEPTRTSPLFNDEVKKVTHDPVTIKSSPNVNLDSPKNVKTHIQEDIFKEPELIKKEVIVKTEEKEKESSEDVNKISKDSTPVVPNENLKSNVSISNGLFDDVPPPLDDTLEVKKTRKIYYDYDEDDLFGSNTSFGKTAPMNQSDLLFSSKTEDYSNSSRNEVDLFSDEPPDYNSSGIFGNANLSHADRSNSNDSLFGDLGDTNYDKKNVASIDDTFQDNEIAFPKESITESKGVSRDEQDNLYKPVNFPTEQAKASSKITDIISNSNEDLFTNQSANYTKKNTKHSELFSDSDDENLFSSIPTATIQKPSKTSTKNVTTPKELDKPPLIIENKSNTLTSNNQSVSKTDLIGKQISEKRSTPTKTITVSSKPPESIISSKPPESTVSKPPESTVSKPSESTVSKPPESTLSKPPESTVSKPPESTVSTSKIDDNKANIPEMDKSKSAENITPPKPTGKLQSNVKINVKALIPGAIPKSVKEIKNITSSENTPKQSTENIQDKVKVEDEPESIDNTLCNDILKDRVKIKVKRRPSTRKARHEAIRKSVADIYHISDAAESSDNKHLEFTSSLPNSPEKMMKVDAVLKNNNATNKANPINNPQNQSVSTNVINKINLFSDDDDDTDLFSNNSSFLGTNSSNKPSGVTTDKNKPVKPERGIFSDSDSDSDLFTTKNTKDNNKTITKGANDPNKKSISKSTPKSIFDETDSDDLFSAPSKSVVVTNKTVPSKNTKPEKELFGDSDDDDDLDIFLSKKGATNQDKPKSVKPPEPNKPSTNQKGSLSMKSATFEDPLSNFLNN